FPRPAPLDTKSLAHVLEAETVGHPSQSTLERTHSTLGQQRRTSDPLLDVRRPQLSNSAVGSTPRRPNSRCSSSGKALPLFSNGLSSSTCPVNLLSSAGS